MNGYLPWFSVEAAPSEIVIVAKLPIPSRDDVDKCMHCPYAECRNCLGAKSEVRTHDYNGRPCGYDMKDIRRMVFGGMTTKQICDELGCSRSTVRRYRKKIIVSA